MRHTGGNSWRTMRYDGVTPWAAEGSGPAQPVVVLGDPGVRSYADTGRRRELQGLWRTGSAAMAPAASGTAGVER